MILSEISWLADENIPELLISHLIARGWKIRTVFEIGMNSKPDIDILRFAYSQRLGILTQDIDFGELVFKYKEPLHYLCRIWPGHINPDILIKSFKKIAAS